MNLDIEEYLPLLKNHNISPEQKEIIIRTIWSFAEAMVDEAFNVHPIQQAKDYQSAKILHFPKKRVDSKKASDACRLNQAANDNHATQEEGRKHA
ncbi:MAG: hypothetical protein ACRBBR_06660 [Cellvibrionaceae bacterium]